MSEQDVERKLQQIDEQQSAQLPSAVDKAVLEKIVAPIADKDVDRILALPRTPLKTTGVTGSVALCEGGEYIVKEMVLGEGIPQEEWLREIANGEGVKAVLCRQLGIPTPGLNLKIHWEGNGFEKVSMIYRTVRVPGGSGLAKTLDSLTAGEIYMYRDALSRERAVSIWIGDFDRKPDNFLVLGREVVSIDGGCADPTGLRSRVFTHLELKPDDPRTMEGQLSGTITGGTSRKASSMERTASPNGREKAQIPGRSWQVKRPSCTIEPSPLLIRSSR